MLNMHGTWRMTNKGENNKTNQFNLNLGITKKMEPE